MFCSNCGKEIDDKAVFCVGCGVATTAQVRFENDIYRPIVGFILSFFISLAGAIVSCVEYKQAKAVGGDHRFALAGMIIGFVSTGVMVLMFSLMLAFIPIIVSLI